eukprot:gnl/TRDRNA2_/TRDRNA2_138072_c0_seq1.p1 gnl/TRDRNA2_/TRDRNA2_138072_c0~~gnl/TRDRNA2_/TRDRNA2_138072_c0_seq1.p1  ORF type:complete len:380 (+),score=59.14 gnl/TRDRNA2_/TRDRNA2_138072_c0_seq1:57-1196(+)
MSRLLATLREEVLISKADEELIRRLFGRGHIPAREFAREKDNEEVEEHTKPARNCSQVQDKSSSPVSQDAIQEHKQASESSEDRSAKLEEVVEQQLTEIEAIKEQSHDLGVSPQDLTLQVPQSPWSNKGVQTSQRTPNHAADAQRDEIHTPEPAHDQEICTSETVQEAKPQVQEAVSAPLHQQPTRQETVTSVLPDGTVENVIYNHVPQVQIVESMEQAGQDDETELCTIQKPTVGKTDVAPWSTQASEDLLLPGMKVRLHNLQVETEFNGREGTCESWDTQTKCWIIGFENGDRKAASCDNLIFDASAPQVHTVQVQRPALQPPSCCNSVAPITEVATVSLQTAPAVHQPVAAHSRLADSRCEAVRVTKQRTHAVRVV